MMERCGGEDERKWEAVEAYLETHDSPWLRLVLGEMLRSPQTLAYLRECADGDHGPEAVEWAKPLAQRFLHGRGYG